MMPPVQIRAARSSKAARRFAAMPGSFLLGEITQRVGSGVPLGAGGVPLFFPFGHPPFFALRRAALALASEVARPPRRPSDWAALFTGGDGCVDSTDESVSLIEAARAEPHDELDRVASLRHKFSLGVAVAVVPFFDGGEHPRADFRVEDRGDFVGFDGSDDLSLHLVFLLRSGLISFATGHNSEPLGYRKRKVKFLLGGGGGSETSHRHSAKKNDNSATLVA